jgi:predicted esterase
LAEPGGIVPDHLELDWHGFHREGERLLFVIHGYGEHPGSALAVGSILDTDRRFRVVAPKGQLDVGPDRRSFYLVDFRARRVKPETFRPDLLDDALDRACEESGLPRETAIVAGFSQGGGLALTLAYRRSDRPPVAGVVGFSCFRYGDDLVDWDIEGRSTTRALLVVGNRDEVFGAARTEAAAADLRAGGVDVSLVGDDGYHGLTPEGLAAARDWIASFGSSVSREPGRPPRSA